MKTAHDYFKESFLATNSKYSGLPSWVYEVLPAPDITSEFDMSPITPKLIKSTLAKCPSKSSPGPDKITYFHLRKLPSTHHFLATLYTKILLKSHTAPQPWCFAKTTLVPKNSDPSTPTNFRPIAMSSVIGKLFHKILARRIESFLLANKITDASIQKGFLRGINGVMEDILAVNAILENAKDHNQHFH